jgi:hypothetical protein
MNIMYAVSPLLLLIFAISQVPLPKCKLSLDTINVALSVIPWKRR